MARVLDIDYAYATARIRAIENRMLTPQKLDRLIDAPSADDAVKMLAEFGYGAGSTDASQFGAGSYEKLLSGEMKKVYELLDKIMPVPEIPAVFKSRSDYLNAKIILKAEFLGSSAPELYAETGNIDPARLSRMITDRDFFDLPEIFAKAVRECVDVYGRTGDPQTIDFILDKTMYENMEKGAAAIGDPYIIELVNILQDMANMRIFIRVKFLRKSREFLSKVLLNGSAVSGQKLLSLAEKGFEELFEAYRYTSLYDLASKLRENLKNGADISAIEKFLDAYFMKHIRKSKYIAMGVEPVIAYLFYKEAEIRNVRLILSGKVNNIPQAAIRERLRAGYA